MRSAKGEATTTVARQKEEIGVRFKINGRSAMTKIIPIEELPKLFEDNKVTSFRLYDDENDEFKKGWANINSLSNQDIERCSKNGYILHVNFFAER